MRRVFLITICMVTALSCSWTGNYEHAYFTKRGDKYLVEMRGRRRLLAHDPLSAIRGHTSEEILTMELPRIEGVIDGAEIPVRPGYLRYEGRVVITKSRMKVALQYDKTNRSLPWNGDYTLVQKDPAETK